MMDLFERLVETSGLSPLFARNALRRACARAGVEADLLTPRSLQEALPEIERTLQTYLNHETKAALERIQALVRGR